MNLRPLGTPYRLHRCHNVAYGVPAVIMTTLSSHRQRQSAYAIPLFHTKHMSRPTVYCTSSHMKELHIGELNPFVCYSGLLTVLHLSQLSSKLRVTCLFFVFVPRIGRHSAETRDRGRKQKQKSAHVVFENRRILPFSYDVRKRLPSAPIRITM